MASLDLLERKLLKIIAETESVKLKRQWIIGNKHPEIEEEQRKRIGLLLRRLDQLPPAKRQEVLELLELYNW
ncbi:hypothetical protein [Brevibacillus invocatus]|uniref:Uncharacterized protein n=1 Tax=Brevibacillus invocatus TaxID=173959 RepID=A0A3M8CLN1_9BACL|nr:hypothetical protein [Brevibacillus invocatus]MCM3080966.1 hypothetical protein [Brevibacillus invocatus]MCM3431182.1 hypothetical protein [Brevibacillus invocatus]RNB76574.1 hypothetical protein EDM52_02670 [Brevibacillus invocatus]